MSYLLTSLSKKLPERVILVPSEKNSPTSDKPKTNAAFVLVRDFGDIKCVVVWTKYENNLKPKFISNYNSINLYVFLFP